VIWPQHEGSDFPDSATVPDGDRIAVKPVAVGLRLGSYRNLPSLALWQALAQAKPDLVWIHEFSPFTIGGLLFAKSRGIPVVVSTEIGRANAFFFPWTVRVWHKHWGHFADGIIANCPAARQPLCEEKLPVVDAFHAVDSRQFLPKDSRASAGITTFVFVGHLIPRKGVDLLLDAAVELRRRGHKHFQLRMIGRDLERWAVDGVLKRDLGDIVEMPGFLSGQQLQDAIRDADVFVLPTRRDTYAAVVHEAACLGMPLLISRHAGACEALVREGVSGFSFLPEDCQEMTDKMERLLDPNLRARMSVASRQGADNISAHRRGVALRAWVRAEFGL
jgi:glycosyltransferase involved in cell wall biosynthesis